jgi:hypothetical protein
MARLPRVTQKIFAGSASNNGVFGSAQAGTKVLSNVLATLMGLSAWDNGWVDAIMGSSKFPPLEEFQALTYIQTTQLAYLLQQGIAEYDSGTTYWAKNIVCKAGTYELYGSVTNSNVGNALSDPTNWLFLGDLSTIAQVENIYTGGTSTGSANAQVVSTLSPSSGFSLSNNGATVIFTAGFDNSSSCTANLGGTGATVIKKDTGSGLAVLTGGEIRAGNTVYLTVNTAASCLVLGAGIGLGVLASMGIGTNLENDGSGNLRLSTTASLATGVTAVTQSALDNSTKVATTFYADRVANIPYLHVREEETANTPGGTFTSGAWRTRTLNTVVTNTITGASLASNQITLPNGTYEFRAAAPAQNVSGHIAKLKNITSSADIITGSTASTNTGVTTNSLVCGQFTVSGGAKVFEIQHQCNTTGATNGFGAAANIGVTEVYTEVEIWKIA